LALSEDKKRPFPAATERGQQKRKFTYATLIFGAIALAALGCVIANPSDWVAWIMFVIFAWLTWPGKRKPGIRDYHSKKTRRKRPFPRSSRRQASRRGCSSPYKIPQGLAFNRARVGSGHRTGTNQPFPGDYGTGRNDTGGNVAD
jgi:hypothetical protein